MMIMMVAMFLLWAALILLVVWGISWLFPAWHAAKRERDERDDRLATVFEARPESDTGEYQSRQQGGRKHMETTVLVEPDMTQAHGSRVDETHNLVQGDKMKSHTVTDPVCRMQVDPATAPAKAEYRGTTYYFCSRGCKAAFEKDPERYVRQVSEMQHQHHH